MTQLCNRPIALFDSGVGGLTVFRAIRELLPQESLVYLGDTARVPYGIKSPATICRYTESAASRLLDYGIKMIVIACNTATAAALPILREKFAPLPVFGVIEPGAEAAARATRNGRIAIIATEATIQGRAYQKAIAEICPQARTIARACTLFVSLAEEGWANGPIADAVAQRYIGDLFQTKKSRKSLPDTLLLGCTHFPLFRQTLEKIAGPETSIVDSAQATARKVMQELRSRKLFASQGGRDKFLTTDNPDRFARAGSLFLNRRLDAADIELVEL